MPLARTDPAQLEDRQPSASGQFSRVLSRNIDGLIAMRQEEERRRSTQERISDAITRFTGSLRFERVGGCRRRYERGDPENDGPECASHEGRILPRGRRVPTRW